MINTKRKIHIFVLLFFTVAAFALSYQTVFAQGVLPFDLLNLKAQNSSLTVLYDLIKVAEAWNRIINSGKPLSQVILGVADTDFQSNHPEFEGVDIGRSPISTEALNEAHGTAVMGIIGANNVSRLGSYIFPQMNGILSGATTNYILGFRPLNPLGRPADFESAMNSLIDRGAKIINLSLGLVLETVLTPEQRADDRFANKKINQVRFNEYERFFNDYFSKKTDVSFVVAAGNQNVDVVNHTPGGQANKANTIAVGATTLADNRTSGIFGSNFGSGVALAAPGENVYAPTGFIAPLGIDDYWNPQGRSGRFFSGTSASAPMVTGVAGLIKAIKPGLAPAQIKQIIRESADPIKTDQSLGSGCFDPSNNPQGFNGCRLNALRAVQTVLATFAVNSTDDLSDAALGDGVCQASNGTCTLRASIQEANAFAAPASISVKAGMYLLTRQGIDENASATGDLDLKGAITITGAGADQTTVDGGGIDRVFHILSGGTVTLEGITIQGGFVLGLFPPSGEGGGIFNEGTLTIKEVAMRNNVVLFFGGGIFNQGTLAIEKSTLANNLSIIDSLSAPPFIGLGAGIYNAGTLSLINSTLSNNISSALFNDGGNTIIANSTFSFSGLSNISRSLSAITTVKNTILAHAFKNCAGTGAFVSLGHNLEDQNDCAFTVQGDIRETDPLLGPLANNRGQTQTHALLHGSPAIDAGSPDCPPPATDQRGIPRPQGPKCDIGSFEFAGGSSLLSSSPPFSVSSPDISFTGTRSFLSQAYVSFPDGNESILRDEKGRRFFANELIVLFDRNTDEETVHQFVSSMGGRIISFLSASKLYKVAVDAGDAGAIQRTLRRIQDLRYNYISVVLPNFVGEMK